MNDTIDISIKDDSLKPYETERSRKIIKNFRSQNARAKYRKKVNEGMTRFHIFKKEK